jgi:AraC-like DNA-binding protein
MRELQERFGETVGLAVLDSKARKGLIVGAVQGTRHRIGFTLAPGTWFPPHTGAPSKAMLAFLPPRLRAEWLARLRLTRFTPRTITSLKAFRCELTAIAARGYALDQSEEVDGCHCVAAPILDRTACPVAAVWLTGPSNRLTLAALHAMAPRVCETAARIAQALLDADMPRAAASAHALLVQRVINHLQARLADKIDWQALATSQGVSYSTLRHVFVRETGTAPARRLLQLRIETACRLLRDTALPVAEIAARTGFSDPNHFSALFSRKTGRYPTRYRREHLNGRDAIRLDS